MHRGQAVDLGVVLSSPPVAYVSDLRIDVVPATAHIVNGAGQGLPITDGTEPHVLRLHAIDPAPGRYALTFRGVDKAGQPLSDGDYQAYLVAIETTRRTAGLGCVPATPPPASALASVSSFGPDFPYSASVTALLGVIRLTG